MLYSNKNREELEKLEELDSLQNQVKELWLQKQIEKTELSREYKKFI